MLERLPENPLLVELLAQAYFVGDSRTKAMDNFEKAILLYKTDGDDFSSNRVAHWLSLRKKAVKTTSKTDVETGSDFGTKSRADRTEDEAVSRDQEITPETAPEKAPAPASSPKLKLKVVDSPSLPEMVPAPEIKKGVKKNILVPKAVPDRFRVTDPSSVRTGSGFITNDGNWVVTNRHVVEGWKNIQVRNGLGDLREVIEVREDKSLDLAILVLDATYGIHVSQDINNVVDPRIGEAVFLIGFPLANYFGAQYPVISSGIVSSGFGFGESASQFQVTAKMNKGNSGGPVFNKTGKIIGVAVSKLDKKSITESTGITPEDVNFALKGSEIRRLAGAIVANPVDLVSEAMSAEDIYASKRGTVVVVITEFE